MPLGTILLIILILLLLGALPTWPYSGDWGYYPSGGLGLVFVVVLVLVLIRQTVEARGGVNITTLRPKRLSVERLEGYRRAWNWRQANNDVTRAWPANSQPSFEQGRNFLECHL